jgi:uncharacterized membrane protein
MKGEMSMPVIHKQMNVKAPVSKVFSYLEDPRNEPEYLLSLTDVRDIKGSGEGTNFKWSYKMAGLKFDGETTIVKYIQDREIIFKTKGGIESTWTWRLEPRKDDTFGDVTVEYMVPLPVLGKLAEKLIQKRNEREMDMGLKIMKENLEAKK